MDSCFLELNVLSVWDDFFVFAAVLLVRHDFVEAVFFILAVLVELKHLLLRKNKYFESLLGIQIGPSTPYQIKKSLWIFTRTLEMNMDARFTFIVEEKHHDIRFLLGSNNIMELLYL